MLFQARAQFGKVLMISCFDGANNVNRGNIGAREGAIVHDLLDAGAGRRDLRREISQAARSIADHSGEPAEPAIRDEAAFHDPAQDIRVDISSAKEENDAFSGEFRKLTGKASRQGRGRRAFHDAFLELDNSEN
jgi:hypothetical protein